MQTNRAKIVAVDGPAGSGKSSICAQVCERLGWTYINTGAIYRAVGYLAYIEGIALDDQKALCEMTSKVAKQLEWNHKTKQLFYSGENLTPHLGSVEAGNAASYIARYPALRELLLPLQRNLAYSSPTGTLLDGRDIGTVVFPDANLKVFMTASIEERAKRRLKQLESSTPPNLLPSLDRLISDIAARDEQDASRGVAPLIRSPDAVLFDTSDMTLSETVDTLAELISSRV